jgi:hypothetical protein
MYAKEGSREQFYLTQREMGIIYIIYRIKKENGSLI